MTQRSFDHIDTWIFDLDNTLYPADSNLFAQVDRRMGEFIANFLGVPYLQARHLQKAYYRQFGTTLSGLMKVHKMEPEAFLDYVHDIDISVIEENEDLCKAIESLPGRKLIYTNGSRAHGERIADKLGVLHLFEGIAAIETCDYVPKPQRAAFEKMAHNHNVSTPHAAMFEDMPHNLEAPHDLGMTTVLIKSSYKDHPAQNAIDHWDVLPDHIHHMTDDLTAFLSSDVCIKSDPDTHAA